MRKKSIIICNKCGKKVESSTGLFKEDFCEIRKEWGYFSKKDMEVHKFNLCESCYDRMIEGFEVPILIEEKSEAL
jgi:ribosomal-protein-alanine N-acetyltransferase